jgi:hypothetical protein
MSRLDNTSLVNEIIEMHFLVWRLFVIKAIHPCGEDLVCCFLLTHNGAAKTNLQRDMNFGL